MIQLAESPYGRRLRWQRLKHGKDTVETAQLLGTTRETISRIENGHQGRRANVFKVQRAAQVFGVPEYYFTATPQEYMERYIRENATALLAQLPEPHQRLNWIVQHLAVQFPPADFTVEGLRTTLGLTVEDFDRYIMGEKPPSGSFLDDFYQATGAPTAFIVSGRGGSVTSFDDVIEEANRRGLSPSDVLWALKQVFGNDDSAEG